MREWNMVIDVEKCEDCNNCFLACKDEHVDNDWPGYTLSQPLHGHSWIDIMRKERGSFPMIDVAYRPTPCMHCENAPCIKASLNGEIYAREDGIVIIDPVKSKGKKKLVKSCPYEAIYWNEEKEIPQKCTFCAHLLDDGWSKPRCVQSCPTGSMEVYFTEKDGMKKVVEDENLTLLYPEKNTRPHVYYKNLYRYERCFIGGSVAIEKNEVMDCAQGAAVSLSKDGNKSLAALATDNYGDFKFDDLEEDSGNYEVTIRFEGREKRLEVELKTSVYMGNILI